MGYRSTPHPATGITPYQGMMMRPIRTRLGDTNYTLDNASTVDAHDAAYKQKMAAARNGKRNVTEHSLEEIYFFADRKKEQVDHGL